MSKQTAKAYLFMEYGYDFSSSSMEKAWRPCFWRFKAPDTDELVFVRELSIEVEIPDDFDPTAQQLAALERAKGEALQKYQQTVAILNERISKLQAITYTPEFSA